MTAIDSFSYNSSMLENANEYLFKDKNYIYINDQNNGNYPNQQVTFELTSLANNAFPTDFSQCHIDIPISMKLDVTGGAGLADSIENVWAMSLKNGSYHLINDMTISYNDNVVNNPCDMSNLDIHYRMLSMSSDDRQQFADVVNFSLDEASSIRYVNTAGGASATGIGECNNVIAKGSSFTPREGWNGINANVNSGRLRRMINTSFDATTTTLNATTGSIGRYVDNNNLTTVRKNGVYTRTATAVYYNMMATIPLAILHDFFQKLPIIRGAKLKLTLRLNTGVTFNLNTVTNTFTAVDATTLIPKSNVPFMISPISVAADASGTGLINVTGTLLKASINIGGFASSCQFVACQYDMTPEAEEKYFSSPERTINFNDYTYYLVSNVASGATINNLIASSLTRIRDIMIFPVLASSNNSTLGYDAMKSPFSSCPATVCPFAKITNFQIQISGRPVFATPINYGYEEFLHNFRSSQSINGGSLKSIGMSSGCIDKTMWENGYGIYYVDLSHTESEDTDNQAKSITFIGKNESKAVIDYHILIHYEKSIKVNVSNGAIVKD
jgi:hypothetical protein